MSSSKLGLAGVVLSQLPVIVRETVRHLLHLSKQGAYLDLRAHLIVAVLRSMLGTKKPRSISATQQLTLQDPGVKGRIWVSKYACPAPPDEPGVQDAVRGVILGLQPHPAAPETETDLVMPDVVAVEAEWTAYRPGAARDAQLPAGRSQAELYAELTRACEHPTTILYLHGGAHYLLDPAWYRPHTKRLAKLTGGRCYSVRYRLSPQNPFPAALVDALVSYLALLYPPPGAFHEAVRPQDIVISGDSAGGNLSMALLQTLLELRRKDTKIPWFGEARELPLPAGVAVCSPWLDMTHSSASWEANAAFDFLPPLSVIVRQQDSRPSCAAWPAQPPRRTLYAADRFLAHPLATLLLAPSWAGSPPVYMCTGWELLADEDKYVAAHMHAQGVPVVFEEYEGMPHCFALILGTGMPGARRCFAGWAQFVRRATAAGEKEGLGEMQKSSFVTVKARTLEEVARDPEKLAPYSEAEITDAIYSRLGGNKPASPAVVPEEL